MTKHKYINPRERAQQVLAEHKVTRAPVPVEAIARKMGLLLRSVPLEEDLSGMIFKGDGAPNIVVNSLHHPNRQRFTIAHEIGHFQLHMSDIGSEVHVDKKFFALARDAKSSQGFDRKEIEANRFAAELLVPRNLLLAELKGQVVDVDDVDLVSRLAQTFEVSAQMMSIRIGELMDDPQHATR